MNSSRWHRTACALLPVVVVLLMATSCGRRAPSTTSRVADFVLLLTFEDLGAADLGCGGAPDVRTPHLDRLARGGFQATDVTSPSRSTRAALGTLLTGMRPSEHRLTTDEVALGAVPCLAEALSSEGTLTAAFAGGAAADRRHGLGRGFDHHETPFQPGNDRTGEPWLQPGFANVGTLSRSLHVWMESHPEGARFAWVHIGADADGSPTDADRVLANLYPTAADSPRSLIVVTSTHGRGSDRSVPLLVSGPQVPIGAQAGAWTLQDATAILAGAFAGSEHLANALVSPPVDRIRADETATTEIPAALVRARELDRQGHTRDARLAYAEALLEDPRLVDARWREAELARRFGDLQLAADGAHTVLAQVPAHPEARVLLARLLLAQRDPKRADKMIQPVLAADPRHAGALAARADIAYQQGDPDASVRDLRAALAAAGERPGTLVAVGAGLSRAGLHNDAVHAARRAVELGDLSPNARYTLAFTLERAERYPESVDQYVRVIREHPRYLPPYRNLGVLMARDGEVQRAIRLWERGLEHHPEDPGLLANIDAARQALGLATLGEQE